MTIRWALLAVAIWSGGASSSPPAAPEDGSGSEGGHDAPRLLLHPADGLGPFLRCCRNIGKLTLILGGRSVSLSASRDTVRAQTEPVDSLAAKEIPPSWWDLENNNGLRWLAKVAAGTGSSIVFAGMAIVVLTSTWEIPERDDPAWHNHGVGVFLYSAAIGSSVGFPFGVSAVDPHDSLPVTLLAGVIPAAAGIGVITIDQERLGTALLFIYVAPVIGSLIVSELWRNPPEDRGGSFGFGLAPTFNGGLSAVTTLRS